MNDSATAAMSALMPAPDEALRCSEHCRALEVNPAGTGLTLDRVVLVAVPLPWPKPAAAHPWLAPLAAAFDAAPPSSPRTRLLAVAPTASTPSSADAIHIRVYTRHGADVVQRQGHVPVAGLEQVALEIITGRHGSLVAVEPTPVILLCTQGSHDVCCGSLGGALATALESQPLGGVELLRASHIGGHRFAPTAISLPDGRMWAYLDADLLGELAARSGQPSAALAARDRGWMGADTGPAQVAESAVFGQVGWGIDYQRRQVQVEQVAEHPPTFDCTVAVGESRWRVEVVLARHVPSVSCRAVGGEPAKVAAEYRVRRIEPDPPGSTRL